MKINTFKPFFSITKRTKGTHDYFGLHFDICNQIHLAISIFGYGFHTGVWLHNVLKNSKMVKTMETGEED